MKEIIHNGYDPQGRGIPQGYEGDSFTETLLLGGKPLSRAFYVAKKVAPSHPHVVRAEQRGSQVMMSLKNMPRDDMLEIVNQNNRNINNKGVKDTLVEKVSTVPQVRAALSAALDRDNVDRAAVPTMGAHQLVPGLEALEGMRPRAGASAATLDPPDHSPSLMTHDSDDQIC